MSVYSRTSIAKAKVTQHLVSLIQYRPSSQFVFELISPACKPELPRPLFLSFYLTLHPSSTLPNRYTHAHSFAAILCARHRAACNLVQEAVECVKRILQADASWELQLSIPISTIIKLLTIYLEDTTFKLRKEIYQMTDGLAMGSPVSPVVANIFMEDLERNAIATTTNRSSTTVASLLR